MLINTHEQCYGTLIKKLTRLATEWMWRQIKRQIKNKRWFKDTLKLGFVKELEIKFKIKVFSKLKELPKLARFKSQKKLTEKSTIPRRSPPHTRKTRKPTITPPPPPLTKLGSKDVMPMDRRMRNRERKKSYNHMRRIRKFFTFHNDKMKLRETNETSSPFVSRFEVQTLHGDQVCGEIMPYTRLLLSLGLKYVPHLPTCVATRNVAKKLLVECPDLSQVLIWSMFFTKNPPNFDAYKSFLHPCFM